MKQISYEEKKRLHELEVQKNVELAKNSSNYCTYLAEVSEFDSEITVYAARRIGRGHVKNGKPCQDYCTTQAVDKGHVLAVSDGVSACIRSDKGSRFACEAVVEAVRCTDTDTDSEDAFVNELCELSFRKLLLNRWLELVKADIAETDKKEQVNIRDIEMYGATLSAAILTENYIITLNLGDGQILLFDPVVAMRVRWHLPKGDSVTAALCNPDCYEDAFIVHKHDRNVYGGILLSTDGIYDTLSSYNGFLSFARQTAQRFEANGESLQPFCFFEESAKGDRWIDLHNNISEDDCSIVLAVDHKPISDSTVKLFDGLNEEYRVTEMRVRADGLSLFALAKSSKRYMALAKKGSLEELQHIREQAEGIELTTAKLLRPEHQLEVNGYAVVVYPELSFFTPAGYFAVGKLREKSETRHGINASGLPLKVLRALELCDDELRRQGFCLNDNARFLAFLTNEGLVLMPEAISTVEEGAKSGLLWQLFENQIGTLTCGTLERPVFSSGFNIAGPNLLNPYKNSPENLCYVKKGADNLRYLVNSGTDCWKFADGTELNPGESVLLSDGLNFKIPETENGDLIEVKYKERKKPV